MAIWEVLSGVHNDGKAKPVELVDVPGMERKPGDGVFYAGDKIDTEVDLAVHNTPGSVRFKKHKESEPQDELAGMTVKELRDLADQEQIVLPSNISKPQIIEAIRGALKYRAAVA